jgi:hypothetical protein
MHFLISLLTERLQKECKVELYIFCSCNIDPQKNLSEIFSQLLLQNNNFTPFLLGTLIGGLSYCVK